MQTSSATKRRTRQKNCALVEFWEREHVDYAIERFQDYEIDGHWVQVREDSDEAALHASNAVSKHSVTPTPSSARHAGITSRVVANAKRRLRSSDSFIWHEEEEPKPSSRFSSGADVTLDDKPEYRRLFCENLSPNVTWRQVKDFFSGYFDLEYADVVQAGGSDAYGVVEFKSRIDALEACMQFNGVLLDGRPIRLRQDRGEFEELRSHKRQRTAGPSDSRKEATTAQSTDEKYEYSQRKNKEVHGVGLRQGARFTGGPRVYVGNIDFEVTWQGLKDHMSQVAPIVFCDIMRDKQGKSKGCGLVEYNTEEDLEAAINGLSGSILCGRVIYVRRDVPLAERKAFQQ